MPVSIPVLSTVAINNFLASSVASKNAISDSDQILFLDTADSNNLKKITK